MPRGCVIFVGAKWVRNFVFCAERLHDFFGAERSAIFLCAEWLHDFFWAERLYNFFSQKDCVIFFREFAQFFLCHEVA